MKRTANKVIEKRGSPRNPAEIAIVCQPYTSTGTTRHSTGMLRNYSSGGIYIETPHEYKSGAILMIRTTRPVPSPCVVGSGGGIRTICLGEVKWQQDLPDQKRCCYGMGVRYLH